MSKGHKVNNTQSIEHRRNFSRNLVIQIIQCN